MVLASGGVFSNNHLELIAHNIILEANTLYHKIVMASNESDSATQQGERTGESKSDAFVKPFTKRNWDAIIDEFEKEEEKDQGVNDLFKQIYQSGSDDVRRAMNKSFQESGGTVLSTNWTNVAEKRVEPKPPSENDEKKDLDPGRLL